MASNQTLKLPNPLTDLAFLPPDAAWQTQIGRYILVGTLGAYIWDFLSNTHNDYKLLTQHRVGLATVAYFFSRLWSLLYLTVGTIYRTYPLGHCHLAEKLVDAGYAVAVSANCLLFFLRARAIFNRNPVFVPFLFCLWLSVVGTAATIPTAVTAINIGPTKYCINIAAKGYASGIAITSLIHDTTVFLSISWRLFANAHVDRGLTANTKAFVTGEYLPHFSRAVLKDGQLYYLITVAANLLTVSMFYNTRVGAGYRTMFTACNVMVINAMGCHVFRNTKFGFHRRVITTSELTSRGVSGSFPLPIMRRTHGGNSGMHVDGSRTAVNITRVVADDALDDTKDSTHKKVSEI
ncbi:hypothetical protein DFH08DRAFT_1077163 [Mycena albidolilacea]|uniref:Transmembrane protein n=1 Tax=Mycena albidolilacea TaxID=1033008 RepID=A0AAD7AD09_9AGAR|nr:hypothetical protein DFH08DRAFT_1077163 [Mycena albidolilacea]